MSCRETSPARPAGEGFGPRDLQIPLSSLMHREFWTLAQAGSLLFFYFRLRRPVYVYGAVTAAQC